MSSAPAGRRTSGLAGEMEGGGAWPPTEGKKKWSIGKLFRRKKKDSDSEASSPSTDEHSQKNNAKRKKGDKKKRSLVSRSNFEHTDLSDKRSQSVTKFPKKEYFDEGVLSDPSAGFVGYVGRGLPRSPLNQSRHRSKDSLYKLAPASSCGSQDGSLRKGRKGRIKARVEAMRNSKNDSSSDDESQKSTSSSAFKFRSDDSLANHSKDGSVSKRSRSARNDRLIKRLSRDDESQLNREADLIQKGFSRSEAELLALKQRVLSTPQINGNGNNDKEYEEPDYSEPMKVLQSMPYDTKKSYSGSHLAGLTSLANSQGKDVVTRRHHPALSGSNSSVYSYPAGIINFNAQVNDESIKYSIPYNVNKQNRTDIPRRNQSSRRSVSVEQNNYDSENVIVIKIPLGSVPKKEAAAPPPPPPRDPQRKVPTPVSYMYDNTRPMSYAFDSGARRYSQHYTNNESFGINSNPQNIYENAAPVDKNTGLSWGKRPISTSEDHIAMQQQQYYNASTLSQNNQPKRPSSVSAEVIRPEVYNRYLARPQINNSHGHVKRDPARRHTQENANPEFMYYADLTPRSRRPIQIAPTDPVGGNNILTPTEPKPQAKNASDFWRKMDSQEVQRRRVFGHNRTLSDQSVSGLNTQQNLPLNVRNSSIISNVATRPNMVNGNSGVLSHKAQENYFKNNGLLANRNGQIDQTTRIGNKENEAICYSNIDIIPMDDIRHKKQTVKYSEDEVSGSRRKSSNLEDALSELEAIYNSLGLGDEDLLDRADRQEMLAPKTAESLPYSSKDIYFRFPSLDDSNNEMNRRGSLSTKLSIIPDKVHDDMAYRRMNPNERPKSKDASKLTSQVSYMLASPVLADGEGSKIILDGETSEPDVVLDDVVIRNIRQANNYLKIEDPQPPFGIPIGPITPAPNSDYLHAVPDSKRRSRFIPQKSPDIVADDLAYRSLRKDSKNPSPVNKENPTCIFNNTSDNTNLSRPSKIFDNHVIKKKRAVRSLSANIFTLVQREIDDALNLYKNPSLEKAQSIPDLPEAVLEFGKSGKLPDNFKSSQQVLNETKFEIKPKANTVPENKTSDLPNSNLRTVNGNERVHKPEDFGKNYSINYLNSAASRLSNSNQIRNELDTMAQEAKETSAKLVIALEELQNEKLSRFLPENKEKHDIKPIAKKNEKQSDITSSSSALQKYLYPEQSKEINIQPSKVNETKKSLSRQLSQSPTMKVKGTIPAHIKEKMEEFSRSNKNEDPSNDFMATINKLKSFGEQKTEPKPVTNTGKNTEDSLIAISNQLKIVGCQLKNNPEKPNLFQEESMRLKYLANKCEIDLNENCLPQTHNKFGDTTVHSSAKYSFLNSEGNSPKPTCISPKIVSSQSKIDTINNMQSFDDLRKGISELLDGIGQVNEKLQLPKPSPQHQQKVEIKTIVVHHSKESSLDESSLEDTSKSRENRASPEYNSSEELAMIFNIADEQKQPSTSNADNTERKTESHLELNSPRLVKTANQNLRKLSLDELDTKAAEPSKSHVIELMRPQALEHTKPLALEHIRPLALESLRLQALEPVRPQAMEPIRPQAMEPAESQMMDQSAEVSTSQEVPWRRNRRLSPTDNANKGKA